MSFRLFVWYCMVGGAWAGFVDWLLGAILAPSVPPGDSGYLSPVLRDSTRGLFLGFSIAFGLALLDAIFNLSLRQPGKIFARVVAAILVGVVGGVFGAFIGSSVYYWLRWDAVF